MSQEQRQQATREEKLVPFADRVKISATNIRIEPTQFWFTVKKLKKTPFYEFGLDDKKFTVDVEVFREILDIYPRVPNEDFVTPPSEEDLLAFLIELGYKGLLDHVAKMFVDHMHQPWRTLATIINKCLSGKTSSNDRLRQLRVAILWGMFYRKNVNFLELIWKDFAYQIDYRHAKLRRREIMPYPRFIKIIINHFLSLNPSIHKGPSSSMHTIKDDRVISRLKFVRIGEDFQEYGRAILETIGKGSQGKKSAVTPKPASVEVSDESNPEHVKRQTSKSDHEPGRRPARRRPYDIAFRDTSSVSKKKSPDQSQKLKGVLDESTVILITLSEGIGTKPRVPYEEETIDEEIEWLTTDEEEEKKDDDEDERSIILKRLIMMTGKFPLTSSSLSVSSGFGNQFLNISLDTSLIGTTKESIDTEINPLLDIQIQQEIPHIQSPSILTVPVLVIPEPTVLSPILEIPIITLTTTLPPPPSPATTTVPDPLLAITQRVFILENDVQELKQVDHSSAILADVSLCGCKL
ncbi:hypothetical protein Tco_0987880 [Tanacetum coccineum]